MAGDWIKMRTNLDTNPHVIAMSAALGIPELHVVGGLWKVWSWVDTHSLDGNAICVTSVTLDRFTGVTGFANAMRTVGWLDGLDGHLCFPRFTEHNGQTAKNRAETAERVAKHRNAKAVTSVTQNPLPEKRREEKNREDNTPPNHQVGTVNGRRNDPTVASHRAANGDLHYSTDFERFWKPYPRKIGKGAARKAFAKAITGTPPERIVEAATAFGAAMRGKDQKFVPHPATWLNREQWDDEPEAWRSAEIVDYRTGIGWPKHLMSGDMQALVEEFLTDELRAGRPVSANRLQALLDHWASFRACDVEDALRESAAKQSSKVDPSWIGGAKRHCHDNQVLWLTWTTDGDIVPYFKPIAPKQLEIPDGDIPY